MSKGPTWFSWFTVPFFAPLSGAVNQDFTPSPYQGVPEIEQAVVQDVASFGRQLGIISEAVLELARKLDAVPSGIVLPAPSPQRSAGKTAVAELAEIVVEIDALKSRHKAAVEQDARAALVRLKRIDKDGPRRLAADV